MIQSFSDTGYFTTSSHVEREKKVVAMVTSCILYYTGHVTDVKLRIAELVPDVYDFLSLERSFDVTEERHAP